MVTARGQHLLGKVLGSCALEKLLGYGGSSAVFLAQQQDPERKVAVKVFLPRSHTDVQVQKDFRRRFLREAEASSELDHPNILPIYSYGEEEGLSYIIMPYLSGGTLSEYVAEHGPLSLEESQNYLAQIAEALDYAHEHGRIHCDVKPANILLDGEGNLFLSDFGIARVIREGPEAKQITANPDVLMGTPDYISPEQALGQALDGRSDVYSLGVTLFFLLAGHPPFKADSSIAMALLHVHEPPPSLCFVRDDISPAVDDVVQRALDKSPMERFQTAGEFSEAFSLAVADAAGWQQDQHESGRNQLLQKKLKDYKPSVPIVHVKRVRSFRATQRSRPRWLILVTLVLLVVGGLFLKNLFTPLAAPARVSYKPVTSKPALTVIDDALSRENQSSWPVSNTFFFSEGKYHIQNKSPQSVALAFFNNHLYQNFRLNVTLSEIKGSRDGGDFSGVVFRSATDQSHYYVFAVLSGNTGLYEFLRYDGQWQTLNSGNIPSQAMGEDQNIILTVEASGNHFTFFVNGTQVAAPASDKTNQPFTNGQVGLYVEAENTEVAFSHLRIEQKP